MKWLFQGDQSWILIDPCAVGSTMSQPEMLLGLRDHGCPNPVSWFPGRNGRSAEPSPVLPAGGQSPMVTMGCSVSPVCSRLEEKSLPQSNAKLLALCYAFMVYRSGISEHRCHQPWSFVAGDTGESPPEPGVIRCALWWPEYASFI